MFIKLLSWGFVDKKKFFSLTEVSVFGGCWIPACSLIACLYHIWGVSDRCVIGQKYSILNRKFLTLLLLPCPPGSLWSLFCAFQFLACLVHTGKVQPMNNCWGVNGNPGHRMQSCIKETEEEWRAPAGNVLGFHAEDQSDVTLKVWYCHRAQCVTWSAAVHAVLVSQWLSLAALWRGWVGFL